MRAPRGSFLGASHQVTVINCCWRFTRSGVQHGPPTRDYRRAAAYPEIAQGAQYARRAAAARLPVEIGRADLPALANQLLD